MNALANGPAHAIAHGCFSGSVTRTVHAKRREGNGPSRPDHTRQEVVGASSHHVVASVTREAPDEMMHSALESIEHLNFEPELNCESLCDPCVASGPHSAIWRVQGNCCTGTWLACQRPIDIRQEAIAKGYKFITCRRCHEVVPLRPFLILGPI